MSDTTSTYRPNGDNLASTIIDGDAVLVNLATGVYYSLDGTAGTVWQMIEKGYSLDAIASRLTELHDVPQRQALGDVQQLVSQLLAEEVVVESKMAVEPTEEAISVAERTEYQRPQLDVYTDMSDLLALDPPMPGLQEMPEQNNPIADSREDGN